LAEASLEELMNIKVTTVSKKEQLVTTAPAAVFVITQDDIHRSGLTTLPEVLRLAPGVQVAQLASGMWAVSVRGDNAVFANRLLVLVDGRSVYNPSFSGVFWNEQDVPLEDIQRIEVTRGPHRLP
jgi:iron complex outermembrane receptor protein